MTKPSEIPVEILVVEDNPGDVLLFLENFKEIKMSSNFHVQTNGLDAMKFLRREGKYANTPKPDLLVLDLYLPIMDGSEVLSEMDADKNLSDIPVVIFSTSPYQKSNLKNYNNIEYIYLTKPKDLEEYKEVVKQVEKFWFKLKK